MFLFEQRAVQDHGVARARARRAGRAVLCGSCTGVGSCAWGVMPSPLHAVRMKRCGHLVPFRTKSLPRPTSKARQQQRPQPSRTPPTQGVYVACVPASVRHACSFPCRLLQRGLHDAVCLLVSCLLVFVLHACSCLSRNLPRGQRGWLEQPRYLQDKVALAGQTGRGGNQREGRKQPTRWSWKDRRVEPWVWLPWTWMPLFPTKTTSKTRPPYNSLLPAASAHFASGQVDTSSLVLLPRLVPVD